jgi:hypothetical protein
MAAPEDVQEFGIGDPRRIVYDLDCLGVIANVVVSRAGRCATRIPYARVDDGRKTPKLGVRAPESAHGKSGCLQFLRNARWFLPSDNRRRFDEPLVRLAG